ncbi:MAG: hypothetical protein HY934_08520 [Candidatus Firestonebacteria bacterium]|nr:hypothetical protein [Candidatus Firestonebacteria bacterium]
MIDRLRIIFIIVLIVFLYKFPNCSAFERNYPKLVWEKNFDFNISEIQIADNSGDVLISDKFGAKLFLFNRIGFSKLKIGTIKNGIILFISSSRDGDKIMYQNNDNDTTKKPGDLKIHRLHFIENDLKQDKIKEFFWKDIDGMTILSPNAKWFGFNDWSGDKKKIKAFDSSGNLLWEKNDEYIVSFSLDGKYVIAGTNVFYWDKEMDEDIIIHSYDSTGKMFFEKKYRSDKFNFIGTSEITSSGFIVWNYKNYHEILNYLGETVTEIPEGVKKAFIAPDGKAALFQYESTYKVFDLKNISVRMEGKMNFIDAKLSSHGNYIVGLRRPTKDIPENIIILDTNTKSIFKLKYGGDIKEEVILKFRDTIEKYYIYTNITSNGKFVLISDEDKKNLYFYQLY